PLFIRNSVKRSAVLFHVAVEARGPEIELGVGLEESEQVVPAWQIMGLSFQALGDKRSGEGVFHDVGHSLGIVARLLGVVLAWYAGREADRTAIAILGDDLQPALLVERSQEGGKDRSFLAMLRRPQPVKDLPEPTRFRGGNAIALEHFSQLANQRQVIAG